MLAEPVLLEEVGSTNDWVRDNRMSLADGQWVVARRQTAGRGRMGRPWQAREGNFMGSCRMVPAPAEAPLHLLSFVAALALHDCCTRLVPPDRLALKWPNDLLLDGAKLSGILLEAEAGEVVLGIGVNLAYAPDVPGRRTTSIADVAGSAPEPAAFALLLGDALRDRRRQWQQEGFAAIRQQWLARAHPEGERLTITRSGAMLEGEFAGLADDGALLFRQGMMVHNVHAADVFASQEGRPADAARD